MTERRLPGRRQFLSSAGLLAGGAALGAGAKAELDRHPGSSAATAEPAASVRPSSFEGVHQPGVVDRQPAVLRFLALDLTPASPASFRVGLKLALQRLSETARSCMTGDWPDGADGIATGLLPAGLTITIGIGATALARAGIEVPAPLAPLPAFAADQLAPSRTGGDLGLQVCGEDPMVVAAASRALLRAVGRQRPRWSQGGFLRSKAGATDPAATPRNLMGQLDGTDNPTGARQDLAVWVPNGVTPAWMANGSYLVCRRIRMLLEDWEQLGVPAQEAVIGRYKRSGAPLTGQQEHDDPNFDASVGGRPVIATDAHIRLTNPANNAGATMLRRGYSFDDGIDAAGQPDLGLFFQAFQTDPHQVFVPIQHKLATSDALRRFIRHEGSAVFAIPPGASRGGFVGETLF